MRLSVCIPLKNRSRTTAGPLFPKCVESLREAAGAVDGLEVVIADFQSDDWPLAWLGGALREVEHRVVELDGAFSRGRGLNAAAEAARAPVVLFLDADMIVPPEILTYSIELAGAGAAYFPICWSLGNRLGTYGWWRKEGWGNCAMSKELWRQVGGWKEHERWGKEDAEMVSAIKALGVVIVREQVEGFIHQWHPNDRRWKERFAATR